MKNKFYIVCQLLIIFMVMGCNKLDEKPKQSLIVPTTLQEWQGVLDNTDKMNLNHCALGEVSADAFYLNESNYNALSTLQDKNAYIWEKNLFKGVLLEADWNTTYEKILYSNIVLEQIEKTQSGGTNNPERNNIKSQALFHRANAFFMLAQEFSKPFNPTTASSDLGIPLKLKPDINTPTERASLKETYDRILSDLLLAKSLSNTTITYKTRPSKAAIFGLLSRFYLSKSDYENAFLNADSCLQLNKLLLNYNTLSKIADFPFASMNNEVIFHSSLPIKSSLLPTNAIIEPSLYNSYSENDERKILFFKDNGNGTFSFRGNYNGAAYPLFSGISTDEIYLTRAECHARLGRYNEAMEDLNTLLVTRYKTGTFIPLTASSAQDALFKIIEERRKELVLRGVRWTDLRRLNQDPSFAKTLKRVIGSQTFTLPPNDLRYTLPIPDYVIASNGMQQNP